MDGAVSQAYVTPPTPPKRAWARARRAAPDDRTRDALLRPAAFLTRPTTERNAIDALLEWLPSNLHRDLTVEALAARCAMSPRHFARVFVEQTEVTPARFVERLRVAR
ncbi:MAG: AraC family transcriptional regulator [Gammaproteobacteria bacterium]|nr:hypothetical protein [Gammaproteobacteria bacterium]